MTTIVVDEPFGKDLNQVLPFSNLYRKPTKGSKAITCPYCGGSKRIYISEYRFECISCNKNGVAFLDWISYIKYMNWRVNE